MVVRTSSDAAVTGRRFCHDFNERFDSGGEKSGPKGCDSTQESKQETRVRKTVDYSAIEPPISVGEDALLAALKGGLR